MHFAIIWGLSTIVLILGILNLPKTVSRHFVIIFLATKAFINLVDIFPGNQTVFRQYAYLATAMIVVGYALHRKRNKKG